MRSRSRAAPGGEHERSAQELHAYGVLDTPARAELDDLAQARASPAEPRPALRRAPLVRALAGSTDTRPPHARSWQLQCAARRALC